MKVRGIPQALVPPLCLTSVFPPPSGYRWQGSAGSSRRPSRKSGSRHCTPSSGTPGGEGWGGGWWWRVRWVCKKEKAVRSERPSQAMWSKGLG